MHRSRRSERRRTPLQVYFGVLRGDSSLLLVNCGLSASQFAAQGIGELAEDQRIRILAGSVTRLRLQANHPLEHAASACRSFFRGVGLDQLARGTTDGVTRRTGRA